jgi:Bacterial pre-peptidase C-terminal domain
LPSGVYDVLARNPGIPGAAVLPGGYTVLDPLSDDFFVEAVDIWTDPVTLRKGATSPVLLGANIHRQGGEVARAADVRFYLGDPNAGGVLLGATTTVPLAPETGDVRAVFIEWATGDLLGAVEIYVQVEPQEGVDEVNEANNLAWRELVILPPILDTTPPTITRFTVNEGAQSTTDPALQVAIKATDSGSGVYSMYLAEQVFNPTANTWLAVQQTGWIPFQGSYPFTLTGSGGVRYIQAWVADRDGNITAQSSQVRINYLPLSDTVLQDQVRVFRFAVASGQPLTVTLETLNSEGDADLYVWGPYHPEGRELWVSDNAGTAVDAQGFVATEAGDYDVEVHGYNPSSQYHLAVLLGESGVGQRVLKAPVWALPSAKPRPTQPADATTTAPADRGAISLAPIAPPQQVFLPLILRGSAQPPPPYRIYLPLVVRDYPAAPPQHRISLPLVVR